MKFLKGTSVVVLTLAVCGCASQPAVQETVDPVSSPTQPVVRVALVQRSCLPYAVFNDPGRADGRTPKGGAASEALKGAAAPLEMVGSLREFGIIFLPILPVAMAVGALGGAMTAAPGDEPTTAQQNTTTLRELADRKLRTPAVRDRFARHFASRTPPLTRYQFEPLSWPCRESLPYAALKAEGFDGVLDTSLVSIGFDLSFDISRADPRTAAFVVSMQARGELFAAGDAPKTWAAKYRGDMRGTSEWADEKTGAVLLDGELASASGRLSREAIERTLDEKR